MSKNIKKSAIILACGQGKRMEPLTFDTPKCFIKINGESLIERNIKQLKEAKVDEIIVLIGYQAEKFKYLKEKYGVTLIYNKDYKIKNNLFTFLLTKDYVKEKDFFILVADNYQEENIFLEEEDKNVMYVRANNNKEPEWECITDKEGRICSIDRNSIKGYVMTGISYVKKEMGKLLFEKAEEIAKNEGSEKYYWEDILCIDKNLSKEFYVKKLADGVFFEFDTMEDLRKLKNHEIDYNSKAFKTIEKVFNIKKEDIYDIELMLQGLSNNLFSFRVNESKETYLMRVPGYGSDEFINRKAEKDALINLQKENLIEYVHYVDEEGYKISTCYTNMRSVDAKNKEDVKRAMTAYKKLHNTQYVSLSNESFIDVVKKQIELSKNLDHDRYSNYDMYLEDEEKMCEIINTYKREKYLCHGDGNPANVLLDEQKTLLVDFEYVSMDDPIRDIAEFCMSAGYDDKEGLELLHIYLEAEGKDVLSGGLTIKELEKLFLAYCVLAGIWGCVWCIVNDGVSTKDFTETFNMYEKMYNDNKKRLKEFITC